MTLDLAPRLGFVALLALLAAFAVLFVHERREADAAVELQRATREAKVLADLRWKLERRLDVAEARLEALETLPLGDDADLLLIRDGVQWLPRVPGSAPGAGPADFPRSIPWLGSAEVATRCVDAERAGDVALAALCRRALSAELIDPTLRHGWHTVRRGDEIHGVHVDLDALLDELREPDERWTFTEPLALTLSSPRLDDAHRAARRTLALKSSLLAVTALLGLGVVFFSRLSRRRLAAQRDFVATVSHELRTPLASVRVLAETLERRLANDGPAKDYPRRIVAAADGLTFFVENILSFNRLEAGRWSPRREPFHFTSLEPMIRGDVATLVDVNVQLGFAGLEAMEPHTLDAELLKVLVLNLTRNAIKYGQRSPVRLTLDGHDEGHVAVLRFRDNGPGIPAGEHERVFDAFHRLARGGGSGLGLALVRRIAGLHGGTARIVASSDEGTTVELRLPR